MSGLPVITSKDFNATDAAIADTGTAAFILADMGTIGFEGSKIRNWVSYVFKRTTRIKIVKKTAFDLASVKILLHGTGEMQDQLTGLTATTYNLQAGSVASTVLDSKEVFDNRLGRGMLEKRFSFPNVSEGSIIEYSYTITSFRYADLPEWYFQHYSYPCLYSSIEIAVPDLLRYVTVLNGVDTAIGSTLPDSRETFHMASVNVATDVHHHKWAMHNIAPFGGYGFIHAYGDYVDKIAFYLVQTYNGQNISSLTTWNGANNALMADEYFGRAINTEKASNLFNTMEKITAADNNPLDAAKSIYRYVRDNFTAIATGDILLSDDLYSISRKRQGSVAEVNLLLVALLKQKGLKADPVVLSTREYGNHPEEYPLLNKLNYVICRLQMYGGDIFLDATRPRLAFGKLPLNCYNGHARIISEKDTGNVFLLPEAIKELKSTTVFLQNDESGKGMTGNFQSVPGYHESLDIRTEVAAGGQEAFFKKLMKISGAEMVPENMGIDSLQQLEESVKIHYDFNFNPAGDAAGIVYFSPMMGQGFKENRFSADQRKYPVEMDAPLDELYVLSMDIPAGYMVEELPKSVKIAFNGNEGFYEYVIQKNEDGLQLRSRIKMNRALFRAEEYNALREFFAFVVKKQAEQIVFKKK